jgi:hypothetical protein
LLLRKLYSQIADETHAILREQGALIEEPLSPDGSPVVNEKLLPPEPIDGSINEKVGLNVPGTNSGWRDGATNGNNDMGTIPASFDSGVTALDDEDMR